MNFFRSLSLKSTQTSVCASFDRLQDLGYTKKDAISLILNNYKKHKPFNELSDEDVEKISDTLSKFGEVCSYLGGLISDCNWEKNINKLKNKDLFIFILTLEVSSKIREVMESNRNISQKGSLNLKETCLHIIKSRKNWLFVEERELALSCKYREKQVVIDFSNQDKNILDVLREIVHQEILLENDSVLDKIDNFDSFFLFCLNIVKNGDRKYQNN